MRTRRVPEVGRKLRSVLLGIGKTPVARLAILVDEDGRLRPFPVEGQPNYITLDRNYIDPAEGFTRTITFRYIRTDLTCQTGHRIYVINEIAGADYADLDAEKAVVPGHSTGDDDVSD